MIDYYQRQIILKDVGQIGQDKLNQTHVLVIGAGGLGCPALIYLASAGIGKISIYDGDIVDESNLHRQTIYTYGDIGRSKAIAAKNYLCKRNPHINVMAFNQEFNKTTVISDVDIIIDCSDNLRTKFIANDLAKELKKAFCVASIHNTDGQLNFFDFLNDDICLRSIWPKEPMDSEVRTCEENGIIGAFVGTLGTLQAVEVIKYILGFAFLKNDTSLLIDLNSLEINKVKSVREHNISKIDYDFLELDFDQSILKDYECINITDNKINSIEHEVKSENIKELIKTFPSKKKVAIFCHQGIKSLEITKNLRAQGYQNIFSVRGGLKNFSL